MNLEALFTKTEKVTYRGVEFEIKELTLEHVPLVAGLVETFLTESGETKTKMARILKNEAQTIKSLVSSMANISKEHIEKLPIDVIAFLASKIISLNIDLIKKNVLPMAQDLAKEAKKQTGSTQSKS